MANSTNTFADTGSTLTTDFNVAPYYDDYDASKQYYRILFKPGYAVQGRELTQIQSTLQKQIDRFGKHVFKEGSIVLPGLYDIASANSTSGPMKYVKVKDLDNSNNAVFIDDFMNQTVTGQTTGISGDVSFVLDGSEASQNTKTIYVDYRTVANTDSDIKTFQTDEILISNIGNLVVIETGQGSAFRISEGVFFAKEHFIWFPTQGIILDRYNDNPSCKVGFLIAEKIVKATSDLSLLDPALEASNYSAPGADRLKLDAVLAVRDYNDPIGPPDFVTLFTIQNGIVQTSFERSQYNVLQDEIAKRTFDESGHYYVKGLEVSLREHLDTGINGGRYLSANGGNAKMLSVEVSPGVGYVQGYEIGTLVPTYLTTDKSLDYAEVNSQYASAALGSYVTVKELTGSWAFDLGTEISLYDTAQHRLTENKWSIGAQTGQLLGTARFMGLEYKNGAMGTPNGKFDLYMTDVKMSGSYTFSSVRSIYNNNSTAADMGCDVVTNSSNVAALIDASLTPMLYFVGSNFTKTIKPGGTSDTTFIYKQSTAVSNVALGTFNLALPAGADQFPYGTSSLPSSQRREVLVSLDADANVTMGGTVSAAGGGYGFPPTTLTGAGTAFDRLNVGDKIEINGVIGTYYIASIGGASSMTLTANIAQAAVGATYRKAYKTGDLIDMSLIGSAAGAERTISATPTQLSFDLKEQLSGTMPVPGSIGYRVSSITSPQINKTLRPDRFVKVNCLTHSTSTLGPYTLGFSDVYRIKEIRKHSALFTSNTEGSNVTSQFVFNTGQKDGYYDHAFITPKTPLTASDNLLVRLDYFSPDLTVGQGFFSIDSYPIDDVTPSQTTIQTAEIPIYKSPTSGVEYDLRNYLDFRPVKSDVATDATSVGVASINPATSDTFNTDANGLRIPAPYSQIIFDYEYYLARKDVVTLNKDKKFDIVRGIPAAVPITPSTLDNLMTVATVTVTPYPSLSLYYANQVGRKDLACIVLKRSSIRFTMRDIGVLKDRIINLEYYTALSLLEKNALDMKILDTNGLDRFKNGIFVDTFTDHMLGATYNPDYRIVVDPIEKSIRPLYTMDSLNYEYTSGTNVVKVGDLVMLAHTETPLFTQNNVTTTRNTERTTYRYLGNLTLDPDLDVWVDTQFAPDKSLIFGASDAEISEITAGITTTWNAWQTHIVGYKVYRGSTADPTKLVGTRYTQWDAQVLARATATSGTATIETIYSSNRVGVENYVAVDVNTQALGDKVIDVSIIPYIRPQIIKIIGRGLKPFARYWIYFDHIDMTTYTTPITAAQYDATNIVMPTTSEGLTLKADEEGNVYFLLRLPTGTDKRFTFGTKEVKVTDSPTNSEDATSFAIGYFVSQGLNQVKQDTIISTRQVIDLQRDVQEQQTQSRLWLVPRGSHVCLAYAFQVKAPQGEEGAFITSVDIYVADKHPSYGMWCEILEMDASGGIIPNQVPFSEVWFTNAQVPISTDGKTNALNVRFQSPVFLQNEKQYAFVIHPEAGNPNYYLWAARIGEVDVNSGQPVTSRVNSGTMYTTNNGLVYAIVPDIDLTMTVYRASFTTDVIGVASLGNRPKEKFYLANLSSSLSRFGETWYNGDRLTLSGISGGIIDYTDFIIGDTSLQNSVVVSVATTYNMSNTGYLSSEGITVKRANGLVSGITATISSIAGGANAVLQKSTESAREVVTLFSDSDGAFKSGDKIFSASNEDNADILAIGNFRYSTVDLEPSYLTFNKCTILFAMKSYSNTGTAGTFINMSPGENYSYDEEKAFFSRSNEVLSHAGAKTNQLEVSMSTTTNFLSPIFDVRRSQTIYVDNLINSNTVGEINPSGGALYNKYISKTVTLNEGQDAEDMTIVLTSYRPPGTDFKVWIKMLHAEDADAFAQRPYLEMEKTGASNSSYSSLSNRNDFLEYSFQFPTANLAGTLGEVQYRNTGNTVTFQGYKYFAIKVGLMGENSAIVPRVADLRLVCTQI